MASSSGNVKMKTRGAWLVGPTLETLPGSKLPSNRQVLGRFLHLHSIEKKTIQESASVTSREVMNLWEKANVPTSQDYNIKKRVEQLHLKWAGIKKNRLRKTETQHEKEKSFSDMLDNLFDIAHANALNMIRITEDKNFLQAQRQKGRPGTMGPVDMKLAKQRKRRQERDLICKSKKSKEIERAAPNTNMVSIIASDSSSAQSECSEDDYVIIEKSNKSTVDLSNEPPKLRRDIIHPELASALDRTKVSDRNAVFILAATAKSFGCSLSEITLNKESIRQARHKHRESIANELKASFDPKIPLTVHWDGKLLPALTSKESVDRLAVLVSGDSVMKLLGVPIMPSGTGEAQAAGVFKLLEDWNLTESVSAMSFDTTASNTGTKLGACVLLEQKLGKNLLGLACRHHILEIIASKVFDALMEVPSGPTINLFKRFHDSWNSLDKDAYESGMVDCSVSLQLEPFKATLADFFRSQLSEFQPRDDYRELLHLALVFLGEKPPGNVQMHAPGACHRARWMAKLIYGLKIYMFRSQFRLTARELLGLRNFNIFVIQIYLMAWYKSRCPESAPRNDLKLLQDFREYETVNAIVSKAAMKSFSGHLWYLSETLTGLAFFDPEVPTETKLKMVSALERKTDEDPPKRIKIEEKFVLQKHLQDFVSENTKKFFLSMDISQEFLKTHPSTWESNEEYIKAKNRVTQLKVVNDAAERGIALITSFNGALTNQEEQKQYLLQVVEKHRKLFPIASKSSIVNGQ